MSDLGSSNWAEQANSNNASNPNGWPTGMAPNQTEATAREGMGAVKRWWDRSNAVLTTGGTSTAYTLTYAGLTNGQAAAAYYNGEKFTCIINATCGASPTLNIDSLGAKNIRKFVGGAWTNCVAGDLQANEVIEVYYNSGAATFDIVAQPPVSVWQSLDSQSLVSVAGYSLQSISTSINHLDVMFDLTMATNNVTFGMQFYNSGGTLDSSAVYQVNRADAFGGQVAPTTPGVMTVIALGTGVSNNANFGFAGRCSIQDIQGTGWTKCTFQTQWLDQGGVNLVASSGGGLRGAAGNITGIKLFASSGNISGKITVLGTAN